MDFVFWQNIVSLHQSAFLSALSKKHEVTLVAEKEIASYRLADGWNIPEMGNVRIVMAPNDVEINTIINANKEAVHIITGIDGFKMPYKAFKILTARNQKVMNMLESYEWAGIKGFLRWAKYTMLQIRYGRKINGILAMGAIGERVYRSAGFTKSKIFQWGYFTKAMEASPQPSPKGKGEGKPRVLFVGRLDENKNSRLLIKTMEPMMKDVECLTIVGDGVLRQEIDLLAQRINSNIERKRESQKSFPLGEDIGEAHVHILGNVPNEKVHELMRNHDILVLPSNYDGWGAVINEALQNGMRVVVSENCGGNVLVDNKTRGEVFYFEDGERSLSSVLVRWIAKGAISDKEREDIILWAEEHISGKNAAEYLEEIVNHVYNNGVRPVAPWMR